MPTRSTSSSRYSAEECKANMPHGVENLLRLYAQATDTELQKGIDWYPEARRQATAIAERYNLPLETVVKVAAAISPKCAWEVNMAAAEWVIRQYIAGCYVPSYQGYLDKRVYLARVRGLDPSKKVLAEDEQIPSCPFGGLKANQIKAWWILQGHDCLSGPKVWEFYNCIMQWETHLGACVDSHAIQGWFYNMAGGTYGVHENFWQVIRADYIRAAELVGLSPLQFQAVLWLVKKRLSGVVTKYAKAQTLVWEVLNDCKG